MFDSLTREYLVHKRDEQSINPEMMQIALPALDIFAEIAAESHDKQ